MSGPGYRQPDNCPSATYNAAGVTLADRQQTALQVDASGQLKIAGTINASTTAVASASAPTYAPGAQPLSQDLSGNLRIAGTINASSTQHSTTAAPTYVNGTDNPLSGDLSGNLRVLVSGLGSPFQAGGSIGNTAFGITGAIPAGANVIGHVITDTGSVTAASNFPTTVDVNSGAKSNSTLRVTLATDQVQLTNALKVDGSATTQPVSGTVTANPTGETPVLKSGLTNSASSVVSSVAATLKSYYCYNPNATVEYVQFFDVATAGAVTVGTTVPKWSIGIPATSAANLSGLNLSFANGIQVAATTTASGASAPGTALDCNFSYR